MSQSPWWDSTVIYELYVDKFADNFSGLTAKLDYFSYLGVTALWVLPHYPSPLVDGGYDISDYTAIREDLGTLADFDYFVASAHAKGLKVIIDLVLNHTSTAHPWFVASRSSKTNPKRAWYLWSDSPDKYSQAFVHFSDIKTTNWIKNAATGDYYYATFYPEQPDLNWDNPEVVTAMLDIIDFWLDRGVDGFRLDAISRLVKRNGTNCFALPETHQHLKNIRAHIDAKYSDIVLMAESGGWPNEAKAFFGTGDECHLVMHFPLAVQLLSAIKDRNMSRVEEIWHQSDGIPANCHWASFLTNHDSVDLFFLTDPTIRQELAKWIDSTGLYTQPNGQSVGARLAQVCSHNSNDIIWATEKLLSQPAVPIIYYGNEIGLPNASFPQKPKDIREFVRGQFDWAQVDRQKLDPESILNRVRNLILARNALQPSQFSSM